jgi:isopenicillin N synthase-like dioxygenase
MKRMGDISMEFMALVAEAIGLQPDAFERFFDEAQQHKLKIVKYPDLKELGMEGEAQGVGMIFEISRYVSWVNLSWADGNRAA